VNVAAQCPAVIDIRRTQRRSDVIECVAVGFMQFAMVDRDVVRPHPNAGNWMTGRPGPCPSPERLKTCCHVTLAGNIHPTTTPTARKNASKHPGVKFPPQLRQWPVAAHDAVESQDQRYSRGLLQNGIARDLDSKAGSSFGPILELPQDERFDVLRVTQRLELADSMGIVIHIDHQLPIP
jgi:hypothetical protein